MIETIGELWKAIELFYGQETTQQGETVYLPRKYTDLIGKPVADFLRAYRGSPQSLYDALTSIFSRSYGKLPDKAWFVKAADQVETAKAEAARKTRVVTPPLMPLTKEEEREVNAGLAELLAEIDPMFYRNSWVSRIESPRPLVSRDDIKDDTVDH